MSLDIIYWATAMVWATSKIRRAILLGKLKILEPSGKPMKDIKFGKNSQASIDVHLGSRCGVWKNPDQNNSKPFDITGRNSVSPEEYFNKYRDENIIYTEVTEKGVTVNPGDLYLWPIYEYLSLSKGIFGRVETKSKWARIGISTHNCAPAIQPGWPKDDSGRCQHLLLEITNTSKTPIILYSKSYENDGTIIAQIFFEGVTEAYTCKQLLIEIRAWIREFYLVYLGWAATKTTIGRAVVFIITILVAVYSADSLKEFVSKVVG